MRYTTEFGSSRVRAAESIRRVHPVSYSMNIRIAYDHHTLYPDMSFPTIRMRMITSLSDHNVRTAVPDLGRGLTVVAQPEDVFARREVLWNVQLVVHRDIRHPLAAAAPRVETRRENRLVARGLELEGGVWRPLRGLSELASAGHRQRLPS